MRVILALTAGVVLALRASLAHVAVQPNEAEAGSLARFVVRVPNERDDAATTKVEVQLPELVAVSFKAHPGWTRTTTTTDRSQPVEGPGRHSSMHGEPGTDYIAAATWEGGRIEPGEFEEFGFAARLPNDPVILEFPALQTYSDGKVVRWIGPENSREPAARVTIRRSGEEAHRGPLTHR